jgi:hypothetical protein
MENLEVCSAITAIEDWEILKIISKI